jgi:hypothetical protein
MGNPSRPTLTGLVDFTDQPVLSRGIRRPDQPTVGPGGNLVGDRLRIVYPAGQGATPLGGIGSLPSRSRTKPAG